MDPDNDSFILLIRTTGRKSNVGVEGACADIGFFFFFFRLFFLHVPSWIPPEVSPEAAEKTCHCCNTCTWRELAACVYDWLDILGCLDCWHHSIQAFFVIFCILCVRTDVISAQLQQRRCRQPAVRKMASTSMVVLTIDDRKREARRKKGSADRLDSAVVPPEYFVADIGADKPAARPHRARPAGSDLDHGNAGYCAVYSMSK